VLESVLSDVQPTADDEDAFLVAQPWEEYAPLVPGAHRRASDNTKSCYAAATVAHESP
jgi:hypothetical protein